MSTPSPAPKETAAARQARILAKSKERLDKITGAAKAEGRVLSSNATATTTTTTTPPPAAPPVATASDDPAEIDLGSLPPTPHQQLESLGFGIPSNSTPSLSGPPNPFAAMFPGMPAGGPAGMGAGGGDDFMAQLMASMSGTGGAPGGGLPGMDGAGMGGGFPGMPTSPIPITPKTTLDKLFPLLHLFAMLALATFAVGIWEPSLRTGAGLVQGLSGSGGVNWSGWGELGGHGSVGGVSSAMRGGGLAEVPLFWMFITIELILQTTRLFLTRSTSTPPSLLSTLLPLLSQFSPGAALAVNTAFKYFGLAARVLDDLAVLVLLLGFSTVVGGYWGGGQQSFVAEVVEKVAEVVGRVEL